MGAVVGHAFAAAMIMAFCVVGVAAAAVSPTELAGRWWSEKQKLTLDISRCHNGWCGVEVTSGACGRSVLRLDGGEQRGDAVRLSGRLQFAVEGMPYAVGANLFRRDDALVVALQGHTGSMVAVMRRTFDFNAVLVRIDDPVCKPDAKVS